MILTNNSIPTTKNIVARKILCFRECAKLVETAKEYGCKIYLSIGDKTGSTESISSLLKLGITKDTPFTISVTGKDIRAAFNESIKIFEKGVE